MSALLHGAGHAPFANPDAACLSVPTSVMFPDESEPAEIAAALAVCRPCSVRPACLDYAIANGERFGVWGGMTTRERWQEVRRRAGDTEGRRCIGCNVRKPLAEFGFSGGRPYTRCKPCRAEYERPVARKYRERRRNERESA